MSKKNKSTDSLSMVAAHPTTGGGVKPVEDIAAEHGIKASILAALRRSTGWAPGKQVTEGEFEEAIKSLSIRPMGGGRV